VVVMVVARRRGAGAPASEDVSVRTGIRDAGDPTGIARAAAAEDRGMETMRGTVTDPLRVGDDLFVSGVVAGGAAVEEGRTLYVHGALDGSLVVGRDAQVLVHGWFDGLVDDNLGVITVVGELATPLELLPGELAVTAGTTVWLRGERRVVAADGRLVEPEPEPARTPERAPVPGSATGPRASSDALLRRQPGADVFLPTPPTMALGFLAGLVARDGTGRR
jgi:hypothetical protein